MRNDSDNELVKKKVKFYLMVIFPKVWKTIKLDTFFFVIQLVTLDIFFKLDSSPAVCCKS